MLPLLDAAGVAIITALVSIFGREYTLIPVLMAIAFPEDRVYAAFVGAGACLFGAVAAKLARRL